MQSGVNPSDEIITHNRSDEKPGKLEIFSFGAGHMGYVMTWNLVSAFLSYFYTDVIGISAAFVGTVYLVMRLWDGVTDIGMGSLLDRTNTKHGKARPFVLWVTIPVALAAISLFTVPNISTTGQHIYIYTVFSIYIILYTAVSISMKTLLGQMTQHQESRATLGVSLAIGYAIGGLIVTVGLEPLASAIGGQKGWIVAVSIVAVIAIVALFTAFRNTTERVGETTSGKARETKHKLSFELKQLLKNKYWVIISFFGVTLYFMYGLTAGKLYYAAHILGSASYFSLIALVQALPGLIMLFFTAPFIKRFGRKNTAVLGSILIILSAVIKYIDPYNLTYFLIGSAIIGMGTSLMSATIYTMANDTVDYGEWRTGVRTPGLVNSSLSFGMKVGTGFGGASIGWLLAYSGYIGKAAVQTAAAKNMIIFVNIHLYFISGVLLLIIIMFYRLDKQYPQIIAELKGNADNS